MPPINSFQKKLIAIAMGQMVACNVHAATVVVTQNNDEGVGCTLREALESITNGRDTAGCTNTSSTPFRTNDTIEFANPGTIELKNGELRASGELTITAQSVGGITIDAKQNSRVMTVVANANVTMNRLTITGGNASRATSNGRYPSGGGIQGGESSQITLNDSSITNNQTTNDGAGIFLNKNTRLNINNSTLSNNTGSAYGGAIGADGTNIQIGVNNSRLRNNYTDYGAGIAVKSFDRGVASSLTITNSQITQNNARVGGGGIDTRGSGSAFGNPTQTDIVNTIISRNTVGGDSGAYGGGLWVREGVLSLTATTVSNNSASYAYDEGALGGGLYASDTVITMTNSTFSNNHSNGRGGGLFIESNSSLTMLNTTISNNSADRGAAGLLSQSPVTMTNSILANSINSEDCDVDNLTSDSQSIIEDASCVSIARAIDPGLGPLVGNGGFTPTHKPQLNSAAINTGDNTTCATLDQRGQTRPLSEPDNCDVGSVEIGQIDQDSFFVIPTKGGKVVIFEL